MSDLNICRRCYSQNTSCCTLGTGNSEKMMIPPVSDSEIQTILEYLNNQSLNTFFTKKTNSPFYIHQLMNLFPNMKKSVLQAFPEDGTHFELKTKHHQCIFLKQNGCALPREHRPHFCRIYPFWFIEGEPLFFQDSDCLALKESTAINEVFLSLGTSLEALEEVYSYFARDLGLYFTLSEKKAL